jgi:hypothetical protein
VSFKPIRCGDGKKATPYLRKHLSALDISRDVLAVDLGCGNLRNTNYLKELGFKRISPFDKAGDFGFQIDLGKEKVPVFDKSVGLILCNYLLCFLNKSEKAHLVNEINRMASFGCYLFVELYPAKKAYKYNTNSVRNLFDGWETIHKIKNKFILRSVIKNA